MLARGSWACRATRCGRCVSLPAAAPNLEEHPARRRDLSGASRPAWAGPCAVTARRASSALKAPKTSFNGRISPHRRFVFGQLSLDEFKAIKNQARDHGQRRGR